MTPYELGIKTAQQRNVPGHLKQAYAHGFAGVLVKAAQASGMNRDALLKHLWYAENAGRTGYNEDTGLWTTYSDNGHPAFGPGVRVQDDIPLQDTYTPEEVARYTQQAIDTHKGRARRRYDGFDALHPQAQKALFDMEYAGIPAPNMYDAFRAKDPEAAYRENLTYTTTDGVRSENKRRDALRRVFIDNWAKSLGNSASTPTTSTPSTAGPAHKTYTVAPGDTFSGIAASRGLTSDALHQHNPSITDINRIQAGQRITVPKPAPQQAGQKP